MLTTETVDLGVCSIDMPYAKIEGKYSGKTILITGGMDGDEYAGIEAAYRLITVYQQKDFHGRIFILPIVNIPGFYGHSSMNPLDGKYPKDVFPGSPHGSPTERLIDYVYNTYIVQADIWIDLHSGSSIERLEPFVWSYETRNKRVDHTIHMLIQTLSTKRVIFQTYRPHSKAWILAKKQIKYIMLESGELGKRKEEDIIRLMRWTKQIIRTVTSAHEYTVMKPRTVYTTIHLYYAKHDGVWLAQRGVGTAIEQKTYLGDIRSLENRQLQRITAQTKGIFLWRKESACVKKNDIVFAIASSPRLLIH